MEGQSKYLCKEHGEFFILYADSLNDAKDKATLWGAEVIEELPNNP
jgi:hypothetical protein